MAACLPQDRPRASRCSRAAKDTNSAYPQMQSSPLPMPAPSFAFLPARSPPVATRPSPYGELSRRRNADRDDLIRRLQERLFFVAFLSDPLAILVDDPDPDLDGDVGLFGGAEAEIEPGQPGDGRGNPGCDEQVIVRA